LRFVLLENGRSSADGMTIQDGVDFHLAEKLGCSYPYMGMWLSFHELDVRLISVISVKSLTRLILLGY